MRVENVSEDKDDKDERELRVREVKRDECIEFSWARVEQKPPTCRNVQTLTQRICSVKLRDEAHCLRRTRLAMVGDEVVP